MQDIHPDARSQAAAADRQPSARHLGRARRQVRVLFGRRGARVHVPMQLLGPQAKSWRCDLHVQ